MLNYEGLKGLIPHTVYKQLLDCFTKYNIITVPRVAHFISQAAHESANFTKVEENLKYSAKRLVQVFPKYFNEETAQEYEYNPVKIASLVYANRMGNSDEDSHEGWEYRGRGYGQLTGKDNYKQFDIEVPDNILAQPDLVATKYPLMSFGWFWNKNKINNIADMGITNGVIAMVTKKVNGGHNGLSERINLFNKIYKVLKNA